MKAAGIEQPSSSARMLFPFAAIALRCFQLVDGSVEGGAGKTSPAPVAALNASPVQTNAAAAWFVHLSEDMQMSRIVNACMQIDQEAQRTNGLTGMADEVLSFLRRWLNDLVALHFINDNENSASLSTIPEELRRNTVAMELLSTNKAFCIGKKQERNSYISIQAELGKYLALTSSFFPSIPEAGGSTSSSSSSFSSQPWSKGKEEQVEAARMGLVSAKKFMTVINMVRYLPPTHKLKKRIQQQLGLSLFNPDQRAFSRIAAAVGGGGGSSRGMSVEIRERRLEREKNDDSNGLWAETSIEKDVRQARAFDEKISSQENLAEDINVQLLRLIADALKVDAEAVLSSEDVRAEVDDVFATWRVPMLLFDFQRIHASLPEMQIPYRRFLRALFGVSSETVDDIRFNDVGNRRHFDRFPKDLVAAWRDSRTADGRILPGYNDAQTLFMLGEDSHTCMMVRARQKGTNRGLLAFLMHGNVRVLGRKDSSGKLRERAIAHLLIDEQTQRPVLYVETPFSSNDEDGFVDVYDQAAELGDLLRIPVIYAAGPNSDLYIMSDYEFVSAGVPIRGRLYYSTIKEENYAGYGDQNEEQWDKEALGYEEEENDESSTDILATNRVLGDDDFVNIVDFTLLSPYVWVDGIKDPLTKRFLQNRTPLLNKRNYSSESIIMGVRLKNQLESRSLSSLRGPCVVPQALLEEQVLDEEGFPVSWASAPSTLSTPLSNASKFKDRGDSSTTSKKKKSVSMQVMLARRQEMLGLMTKRPIKAPKAKVTTEVDEAKSGENEDEDEEGVSSGNTLLVKKASGGGKEIADLMREETERAEVPFVDDGDDLFG